jgi:hypothetical protein
MIIAACAAVMLAVFGVKIYFDKSAKAGADNCVGEPTRNTVILLDHTDGVTDQARDEVVARAMKYIHEQVQVNEKVSIFAVTALSKKSLRPIVSLCRPPNEGNRIVESPELIKRKFVQRFEKPVKQALSIPQSSSKESPIAQAVSDLSLSQYLRGESNALLIFSDMLEHTSRFSLYDCQQPEQVVAQYKQTIRGGKERPTFKNTLVVLNMIPRPDEVKASPLCRDKFWPWFFGDNKGSQAAVTLDYLPGR